MRLVILKNQVRWPLLSLFLVSAMDAANGDPLLIAAVRGQDRAAGYDDYFAFEFAHCLLPLKLRIFWCRRYSCSPPISVCGDDRLRFSRLQ